MIDLAVFIWNWGYSLFVLVLHFHKVVVRKAVVVVDMAVNSTISPIPLSPSPSPPLPWKRLAESPLLSAKRSKENSPSSERCVPVPRKFTGGKERLHDEKSQRAVGGVDVLMFGGKSEEKSGGAGEKGVQMEPVIPTRRIIDSSVVCKDKVVSRMARRRPARIVIPEESTIPAFEEAERVSEERGFEMEGDGFCLASKKGNRRKVMEDGYGVITNINGDSKQAFFGVFDGHGGRPAVDHVSEKLGYNILEALHELEKEGNPPEMAIRQGYLTTDKDFLAKNLGSGACAATVLMKNGELHAANAGDCKVVMSRNGEALALTSDHRAGRDDERSRIESTGGYVNCHNGVWRVQNSLSISRAFGDMHMKEWIISEPEINRLRLTSDCEFLIMASDGFWDKVTDQEAVDVVSRHRISIKSCKTLVDMSSSRGSRDDITVMVVDLQRFVEKDG